MAGQGMVETRSTAFQNEGMVWSKGYRMFVQRMSIISDWLMCSMSESDDVGNKAEEGAWERTGQGLEFQSKNVQSFIVLTFTNGPGKWNPGPSFLMCGCKTGWKKRENHLKAIRNSLKVIWGCLTKEMFALAAGCSVAEDILGAALRTWRGFLLQYSLQVRYGCVPTPVTEQEESRG